MKQLFNFSFLTSLICVVLLTILVFAGTLQAQTYVSATNGDDTFGTGSQATPYRSITKAITSLAATGGTISVEAGIYNSTVVPGEASPIIVSVGKTFTFVGTAVGGNTTVTLTDGFVLNHADAVVNMGLTGTAGFNLGSSTNALKLSAGAMNIVTANVTLVTGATLTITEGTLNTVPTKGTNLIVVFNGTSAISSTSAFLPTALGSGTLTINKASGAITIDNAITTTGTVTISNVAGVTFGGNLSSGVLAISGAAAVTFNGTISASTFTTSAAASVTANSTVTASGLITISAAATVNLKSNVTTAGITVSAASAVLTVDGTVTSSADITVSAAATVNLKGNVSVGSASALKDITNSTGTVTIGTSSSNTLSLYTTGDATDAADAAKVGQIINSGAGSITINSAVTVNIKNSGTSTSAADGDAVIFTPPIFSATSGNITVNGSVAFTNTNIVGTLGTYNDVIHTVTLSNSGAGTLAFGGIITTPNSTAAFTTPANAVIWVKLSNTGGGTFTTRAAALKGVAGTTGITNSTVAGTMTLGQVGDAFTATWDIVNDITGSTLTLNGTGTLGGALTNGATSASAVVLGANQTIAGIVTVTSGTIKLNANTLTLSGTGAGRLANSGTIFSTATNAIGSGWVKFTGAAPTMTGTGALPNVEIASATTFSSVGNTLWGDLKVSGNAAVTIGGVSVVKANLDKAGTGTLTINDAGNLSTTVNGNVNMTAGSITLGTAGLTVDGSFNMSSTGTFTFGTRTLTLKGNFTRTAGGTIDATAAGTGTLNFAGATNQTFTPGTQMNVYKVTVNNTGNYIPNVIDDNNVTVTASLIVLNDFTITTGRVLLGINNIRMAQAGAAASARFTNGDRGYSASGVGGIIFEGVGNNPAGTGDGCVITGTQTFSNIYVRLSTNTNNVLTLGAVKVSGTVTFDGGGIEIGGADDVGDLFSTSTLLLDDAFVIPTVVINTQNGHASPYFVTTAPTVTSVYNLSYTGQSAKTIGALDFTSGSVQNLSILAGTAGKTVTFIAGNGTITGALTVDAGDVLDLANGGPRILTVSNNTATHTVNGTVTGGTLAITGNAASLTGGVGTTNASSVATLTVTNASGTFTSTGMKVLGVVTINGAALTSNITLNSATATVNTFTNTAGTTSLNMNSTAVAAGGNYLVTAGAVNLTMNGAAAVTRTITGTLTVNGGTLTLGSNVDVTGAVSQAGAIVLGNFNLTLADNYTHTGTGTITAGTGKVIAKTAAAKNYTFTTAVDIPNFTVDGAIVLVSNGLKVTNAFVHTSGALDLNALALTVSGPTYTYTTGTYANTGSAATGKVVLGDATATTITAAGNVSFPNLEVKGGAFTVVFASSSTTLPRNFTVTDNFTHTSGNINLGFNDLVLTDNGTANSTYTSNAATGATVSGTSTGSNIGEVVFNGSIVANHTMALTNDQTIQNIKISRATTKTGTKVLTVSSNFALGANFTFTATARLVLGDGLNFTRSAGVLDIVPTFGSSINMFYTGGVTTGVELPTTAIINNLTVDATVSLNANAQVNGTLFLKSGAFTLTASTKTITMGAGATINRTAGTVSLTPTVTTYNLIYSNTAAGISTADEFSSSASAVLSLTISGIDDVILNANRTVGSLTMSPTVGTAALLLGTDAAPLTLTVTGAASVTNGVIGTVDATTATSVATGTLALQGALNVTGGTLGGFGTDDGAGNDGGLSLSFTGSGTQTIALNAAATFYNLVLNQTGTTPNVSITGGNVTISGSLTLTKGLLNITSPRTLTLAGSGQGFTRGGSFPSHVLGIIQKAIPTSSGRFEFPVGSSSEYRPAAFTFATAPIFPFILNVSHVNASPEGSNGLPIVNGISTGVNLEGYPNFYWLISSSSNLGTAIQFNLELTAAGYSNFGNIADLRMIRRVDGDTTGNPWSLQGTQYDNYIASGVPTVTNINSTGGINPAGARFTYGLKGNLFVLNPIANQTLTVGGANFTRNLNSPAVFGGNEGILTYTASSSSASVATASVTGSNLTVTPVSAGTTTITVTATDVNSTTKSTTFGVTVNPGTVSVSGSVLYANAALNPIANVNLTLTPTTGTPLTTTSDAAGNFTFSTVAAGTYTLTASKTGNWGGVNSTDALQVSQFFAGLRTFTTLQQAAADVNNNGLINNTDALQIVQRFAGIITSFAKGDWVFDSRTVTVASVNLTVQNVNGLAVGDVNASYTPPTGTVFPKSDPIGVVLEPAQVQNVNAFGKFDIPVRVSSDMTLGAVSLRFSYPADMASFEGVTSTLPGMVYKADGGVISIGWVDMGGKNEGVRLEADDVLVTLKFAAKTDKGLIAIETAAGSEFADMNGNVLSIAGLSAAMVKIGAIPSVFELAQNYPNPFNPSTEIEYSLPKAGIVTLTIFNIIGQEVARLVDGVQEAGVYKVQWNASELTSGIYYYILNVEGGDKKFTKTQKMMLLK